MKSWFTATLAFALLLLTASCKKDKISDDLGSMSFSVDTVLFDTVFTQTGTATRNFKVYNTSKSTLRISDIRLARTNSQFRINVNGQGGTTFTDIEILPDDSMFIFVEATINPNGANSPLVVTDSIVFTANGQEKDIDLVAWGQDANYYKPIKQLNGYYSIISCNDVWTNTKPYVIYGTAVVDSACSLTIQAGTKVYFHGGSSLYVYRYGQLKVNGTKDQPVIFQGDRLEPAYKDNPGQWGQILINQGYSGVDNVINYAIIKNAVYGLHIEPLYDKGELPYISQNKTTISNCVIQNHSGTGILTYNSKIEAYNTVVSNCATYCIGIGGGGEYNFTHVTAGNYWSRGERKTPAFAMGNIYTKDKVNYVASVANSHFTNCIFFGNKENEFDYSFDPSGGVTLDYTFENCIVKRKDALAADAHLINIKYNDDPLFKDPANYDFHLFSTSPAINYGKATPYVQDLDGVTRNQPDLGAYEFE